MLVEYVSSHLVANLRNLIHNLINKIRILSQENSNFSRIISQASLVARNIFPLTSLSLQEHPFPLLFCNSSKIFLFILFYCKERQLQHRSPRCRLFPALHGNYLLPLLTVEGRCFYFHK